MKKSTAIVLTILVGTIAIGTPIWFAIREAKMQGMSYESGRALSYARDVIIRSDGAADQFQRGLDELTKADFADPCSDESIALMRRIDLSSSYLQTIGYVSGDRLVCSSLGRHGEGLALGPVEQVTRRGTLIRGDVELPLATGTRFVVLERSRYAAVIHKDLPIDVTTSEKDVALAIFSLDRISPLSSRGAISVAWLDRLGDRQEVTFLDDAHVVAVVRSTRYLSAAVAAVPVTYLDQRVGQVQMRLIPIGVLAGVALTFLILYLARLQMALPAAIRSALKRNEFFLTYQPIVDLQTGKWIGAEALIRWRRPVGEIIGPDFFIPIAEQNGLMPRITERIMELVAHDAGDLFRSHPDFHIAINLSSDDLHEKRTLKLLHRVITHMAAEPRNVIVEATERGFVHVDIAREIIDDIRGNGVGIAIDDFGTGYSGLSYLQAFRFDFLKIDKSFVETIGTDAPTSQVVHHIIEMAKGLNLTMIAEGVETEAQAAFLRDHGVQYAQGWLYGRPMALADIANRLSREDVVEA